MPITVVEFNADWYQKFVQSTNEKELLVSKIAELLNGKPHNSCLEIGLGILPYFANQLANSFKQYKIVEKRIVNEPLTAGVSLINKDWEKLITDEKFDVVLASHVVYYFKNKRKAVQKMFDALNDNGRVIFVVNGKESDYGPLKFAFASMLGTTYKFTYDELMKLLKGRKVKEYTLPAVIRFNSYEDLYETLRLSFDSYPDEYERFRNKVIDYLKKNVRGGQFIIDQKIIEIER